MQQEINILLIEDETADSLFFRTALNKLGYKINLRIIDDGQEAFEYIDSYTPNNKEYREEDIIFLDINLPKVSGTEVLRLIKTHHFLSQVPVVVLSSIKDYLEIKSCYSYGANSLIDKPEKIREYTEIINKSIRFWLKTNLRPTRITQ